MQELRRCGFDLWVRKITWRKKLQPIPVISPGESCRHRSLVGYSPRGSQRSWTQLSGWACTPEETPESCRCPHPHLLSLCVFTVWERSEKVALCKPEEEISPEAKPCKPYGNLDLGRLASKLWANKRFLFRPLSLVLRHGSSSWLRQLF